MKTNANFTNRAAKIKQLEALIAAYPDSKHTPARKEGVKLLKAL